MPGFLISTSKFAKMTCVCTIPLVLILLTIANFLVVHDMNDTALTISALTMVFGTLNWIAAVILAYFVCPVEE